VAITFDDGPAKRTPELLDVLARYPDVRVTFFVNGNNYVNAALPEYQAIIARAFNSGHQIASHTFQHKDLATLSDTDIQDQMISNDDVIYSATGRVPRYMRPPYGSTDADSLAALGALGYVVTNWGVDTRDWADNDAEKSADEFEKALAKGPSNTFIALAHDTVESTAADLMDLVIPLIRQSNLRMVTIAECLGDSHPYL
jgi:peptidoglycan/xylan/chitin deacetylase (PgdA/CDA1 family)